MAPRSSRRRLAGSRRNVTVGVPRCAIAGARRTRTIGAPSALDGGIVVDGIGVVPVRVGAVDLPVHAEPPGRRRPILPRPTCRSCARDSTFVAARRAIRISYTAGRGRRGLHFRNLALPPIRPERRRASRRRVRKLQPALAAGLRSALCGVHCRDRSRGRRRRDSAQAISFLFTRVIEVTRRDRRSNLLDLTPADGARASRRVVSSAWASRRIAPIRSSRRLWLNPAPTFDAMTELPKALREALAAEFDLPAPRDRRASEVRRRNGEVSLPPARRRGHRDRRDSRRRSHDAVHLVAGGMRAAVRVLRDGRDGLQPEPHAVRDRRPGARDAPARSADPRHEHRVHGHGRAADELEGGRRRRSPFSTIPTGSASARDTSPSRRSACCPASSRSANVRSSSASRSRSTRRTTRCAAS